MSNSKISSEKLRVTQALLEERAQRQALRSNLHDWTKVVLTPNGQQPSAHHTLLLDELESVSRGDVDRLMVLMPPGSAKSTYASILFPAWWFTQHPASAIIAASHTADLAEHFGRQVRNLVAEHGPRLGYSLVKDNRSAARWQISTKGHYYATGVRGPITGRRADLILIDDPVKSQVEADNIYFRNHLWDWYRSDLTTRLKPRGRIALIMTRWHQDDLGGRLLATEHDQWRIVRLPALAEENDPLGRSLGAALWPEWESATALERKRKAIGERAWAALFQQMPRPPAGAIFKIGQIPVIDTLPNEAAGRTVRAWDVAATADARGSDPDWTVGLKLHRTEDGHFIVLDVVRFRGTVHEVNQAVRHTAEIDGNAVPIGIPQDPGSAGKFMVQQFAALLAGYKLSFSPETGSKAARAAPISAQAEAGNLSVFRSSWSHAFLEELRDFPQGSKDDQVDALSRAFMMLLADSTSPTRRLNVPLLTR